MPENQRNQENEARQRLLQVLLEKVERDTYPSTTMLDLIEELLEPERVGDYAEILIEKINRDQFPSLALMARVKSLA